MDRLQKKCIIASTTAHSLLLGTLLFGSALMPSPKGPDFKPITVYRSQDVSDALSGGGSPEAAIAPAPLPPAPVTPKTEVTPPAPKPKPAEPVAKPIPEPPKVVHHESPRQRVELPRPVKMKPVKEDLFTPPKSQHKIEIDPSSLKQVVRNKSEKNDQAQAAADARARAERRRLAKQIETAYNTIGSHISSSTVVEMSPGVGGTPGEASINYRDLIASKYYNAWNPPTDLDDATPPVSVSLTIDRDGNVKSARITTPSGNRSMDRSIQNVLEAVTFFEPFPAGSKDQERSFTIRFNLQAKRATG